MVELGRSDGTKQNSIRGYTGFFGFSRKWRSGCLDRRTADQVFFGFNFYVESCRNFGQYLYGLAANLWTDAVTGQNSDLHNKLVFQG